MPNLYACDCDKTCLNLNSLSFFLFFVQLPPLKEGKEWSDIHNIPALAIAEEMTYLDQRILFTIHSRYAIGRLQNTSASTAGPFCCLGRHRF